MYNFKNIVFFSWEIIKRLASGLELVVNCDRSVQIPNEMICGPLGPKAVKLRAWLVEVDVISVTASRQPLELQQYFRLPITANLPSKYGLICHLTPKLKAGDQSLGFEAGTCTPAGDMRMTLSILQQMGVDFECAVVNTPRFQ